MALFFISCGGKKHCFSPPQLIKTGPGDEATITNTCFQDLSDALKNTIASWSSTEREINDHDVDSRTRYFDATSLVKLTHQCSALNTACMLNVIQPGTTIKKT